MSLKTLKAWEKICDKDIEIYDGEYVHRKEYSSLFKVAGQLAKDLLKHSKGTTGKKKR